MGQQIQPETDGADPELSQRSWPSGLQGAGGKDGGSHGTAQRAVREIKAAEKRMAEIAVLRTHIVNYAKTRDTYAAYRKAGYSPKFRSEHEADILLHQAAKQAFDQLNVKKLPKMKALQAEYAALLAEKKEAYAELRKARDEAQELLIVKANVDRILQNTERGGNAQEKGTVSFAANCALY